MKNMGDLAEKLLEELECETVFTIPVFGGIHIDEATVVSWIIMAVVTLLSICLVRGFRVHNQDGYSRQFEAFVMFYAGYVSRHAWKRGTALRHLYVCGADLYWYIKCHWHLWYEATDEGLKCHSWLITNEYYFN